MENPHSSRWIPWKWWIFHGYVSLHMFFDFLISSKHFNLVSIHSSWPRDPPEVGIVDGFLECRTWPFYLIFGDGTLAASTGITAVTIGCRHWSLSTTFTRETCALDVWKPVLKNREGRGVGQKYAAIKNQPRKSRKIDRIWNAIGRKKEWNKSSCHDLRIN